MGMIDCRKLSSVQWFVLYTASRAEKKVAERLGLNAVEHYLPLLPVQRKWSDRIKIVEVPLFNSYVFVKVRNCELSALNKVEGVVKILHSNGVPAVVRDSEIELIKEYIKKAGNCELITGDMVEVVCGSFVAKDKLVKGKIVRIKKDYLYLYIKQLGASVCVKKCDVRKVKVKE